MEPPGRAGSALPRVERWGMNGRKARVIGSALVLGTLWAGLLVPASASSPPGPAFLLRGSRTAGALVTLPHKITLQPHFNLPTRSAGYVGLEVTRRDRSSFAYYAFVLPDGGSSSGAVTSGSASVGFGGGPSTSAPASFVNGEPVTLPAGQYVFTLLTHSRASVALLSQAPHRQARVVEARLPTGADIETATFTNGPGTAATHHSVRLRVPRQAHLVLTLTEEQWAGNGSLDYTAECLGQPQKAAPCPLDPSNVLFAAYPSVDDGHHRTMTVDVWTGDLPVGSTAASFDSAKSGTISSQTIAAIALP